MSLAKNQILIAIDGTNHGYTAPLGTANEIFNATLNPPWLIISHHLLQYNIKLIIFVVVSFDLNSQAVHINLLPEVSCRQKQCQQ